MTVFGVEVSRPAPSELLEHGAAWVALGSLAVTLAADGGRQTSTVVWMVLACLPALLLTTPWRWVPSTLLLLLAAVPTAAIVVCYLTPTKFAYSRDLIVFAYGAVLATVAASYVRTPARRAALVLFVCGLGFYDYLEGFSAWRFHDDPGHPMVGTFYQQDMFGAFCCAVALVAGTLAVLGRSPWRWVGWVVAPIAVSGTVLSTGRAPQALLIVGVLTLLGICLTGERRAQRVAALAGLIAVSIGLLFLLTGPLLFPHSSGSPISGTTRRAGSDSLGSSSSIRQAYWRAAVREFADAPFAGEGLGAFGLTFFDRAPLGAFGSRYAHNGFLQAFAEGGLLLGLPLLLLGLLTVVAGLRALPQRGPLHSPWRAAAALGALALLGHSLVDFDWTFPVLAGLLAALAAGTPGAKEVSARAWPGKAFVLLLTVAVAFSAYAVHHQIDTTRDLARAAQLVSRGEPARAAALASPRDTWLLPNPLAWSAVLAAGSGVPHATLERALTKTAGLGRLDPNVEFLRARTLVALGRAPAGLALGRQTLKRSAAGRPDLYADYAELLASAGQREAAVRLLSDAVARRAHAGFPLPDNVWRMVDALEVIGGLESEPARCAFAAAHRAFGQPPTQVAAPAGSCSAG
jgi:O-antigen ligase